MMRPATFRLVLLVSCCHAMVHVYELSFASVEQLVAADFGVDTAVTGWLGFCLRLPFGLFALLTGWAADHFGAKRLLLVYLFGASGASLLAWFTPGLAGLFVAMFTLGMFAAIYHPAGVGLISHETRPENRPMALGYHGILGSAGIAAGPFLAAFVLAGEASWRRYYLILSIPGLVLGALLALRLSHVRDDPQGSDATVADGGDDDARWDCYFLLILAAVFAGFVYSAVMTFLPRYLAGAGVDLDAALGSVLGLVGLGGTGLQPVSVGNLLTGGVLLLGIVGQYTAGRLARPHTLEPLMAFNFLAVVPCLVWMGLATGWSRVMAAGLFVPIFFMHQPLFNSLVAKYVPRRRRSLAYGFSFTVGFGVGSTGSAFAGKVESTLGEYGSLVNYGTLAAVAFAAGMLVVALWRRNGSRATTGKPQRRQASPQRQ